MARLPRLDIAGVSQHLIQRGNNHQACFENEQDMVAYAHWLCEYADKFGVNIHAWVFMTNHVHLLVTPQIKSGVSQMMQGLGRRYVQYFNYTYKRSGTLWEGRYKSCAVQNEGYVLRCYRYIELNPVRACMVTDPADYAWSSYRINALGVPSNMCTPHQEYRALGSSPTMRRTSYRNLFSGCLDDIDINSIRTATKSGMALGSEYFKDRIEHLAQRRTRLKKVGRPRLSKQ